MWIHRQISHAFNSRLNLSAREISLRFPVGSSQQSQSESFTAHPPLPKHAATPPGLRGKGSRCPQPLRTLSCGDTNSSQKPLWRQKTLGQARPGGSWHREPRTAAGAVPPRGIVWDAQRCPQGTGQHGCTPERSLSPAPRTILPRN